MASTRAHSTAYRSAPTASAMMPTVSPRSGSGPSMLGAYDLGEELGRGSTGIVLAGHHRGLGRDGGIKPRPRLFGSDPALRRRFLSEARLLASLDHAHIVRIYDYIEADG